MSCPPGGISNGPSSMRTIDKDAQIWERPWTLEEMQQSGANWSLAADTGVSQNYSPDMNNFRFWVSFACAVSSL